MATRDATVIVVGAGISGLTAARHLRSKDTDLQLDQQLIVLEAKDRVGGRTQSVQLKTDSSTGTDTWDIGGQWVGNCQPHIMRLVRELGLETHSQYIDGAKFLQTGTSDKISSYKSHIPTLSLFGLLDLDRMMKKSDSLSLEVDPLDPYSCPEAETWDSMTLETFVHWNMRTTEAKDVIRAAMRCMFGAELSQMSMLYFLMYVAAAGNMKDLTEATEGTAQEFRIKGGAQQISWQMYDEIGSSNVFLNEAVTQITQGDKVTMTTSRGNVYTCQKVILAIPPSQIGKIVFSPILPVETREIVKRMPPSNIIKIVIVYKEAFWRHAGYSGEIVTNGGPSTCGQCSKGPLCIAYDATSGNGHPALLTFIGGMQAVEWQQLSVKDRQTGVLQSMAQFYGDEVYNYTDYREKIWDEEPYNDGAPVSCVGPGAMKYLAKGLRQPFGRVHFAGTESATIWCGFMNGAVQAGRRAAIEVLYDLRPQLVTVGDLTEPKTLRNPVVNKSSRGRKIVKWTLIFVVTGGVIYSTKKLYDQLST